jgi:hypothetical protein
MEPSRVVVRYANGEILKGFTQDFSPNKDRFRVFLADKPPGQCIEVLIKDLKAVFLVRDFVGNTRYVERKKYLEGEKPLGRKLQVTFHDGEVIVGTTLGYDPSRPGFFLFPADAKGNNIRVYVISSAVREVRPLQ